MISRLTLGAYDTVATMIQKTEPLVSFNKSCSQHVGVTTAEITRVKVLNEDEVGAMDISLILDLVPLDLFHEFQTDNNKMGVRMMVNEDKGVGVIVLDGSSGDDFRWLSCYSKVL
uniref:Uncharacterized protein n=1 Tax=Lactuca sativa TaxID=4236 RepID=A0A9R1VSQ1_LACSA|nr:hypothetical protein LSAT_V11C400222500 [Lactuca sativa]